MRKVSSLVGFTSCFLASAFFSSKAILVKLAYAETSIDSVTLLMLRMVFSLPFFVIPALFISSKKANIKFTHLQWFQVAIIGCLGYYISSLLDFIGLQFVSAGIERLILFIYPTLVLLISLFIYKEPINNSQWSSIVLCYIGLAIAFSGEVFSVRDGRSFYLGALAIFSCAFTYAAYVVGSGKLIPTIGAAKFNSYAMSFAAVGVIIHFTLTTEKSLLQLESNVYFYSFLMAIVATVIPSYLVTEGIKRIGSNNSAIVSCVGPISTIIQGYFFLDESISTLQIIGTISILSGVTLISFRKKSTL